VLLAAAGAVRWDVAHARSIDVQWTTSGELVQFRSSVAKISLETGALAQRHCGWSFGLSEQHSTVGRRGEPTVCDAPDVHSTVTR
jgi:hypothetical protein